MKQLIAVVLHQAGGAFHVEVRENSNGHYARWICRSCGVKGESAANLKDSDEAFESAKEMIAAHRCAEQGSATE
jgi:hypothetical protein